MRPGRQNPHVKKTSQQPRPSAYVIPYVKDEDGKIWVLFGKSRAIHFKALVEFKLKKIDLPTFICGFSKGDYFLDKEGRLVGKNSQNFRLGPRFGGVLMEGQAMFPGGKCNQDEPFEKAALRELNEEFYLDLNHIVGIENHLKEIWDDTDRQRKFYSLCLNDIDLTCQGVIENFERTIKSFGDLSPQSVWDQYNNKDDKELVLLPEVRKICMVSCDELVEALKKEMDFDWMREEVGLFADVICRQVRISTSDQFQFKQKLCDWMDQREPNIGQVNAANLFVNKIKQEVSQKPLINTSDNFFQEATEVKRGVNFSDNKGPEFS